jgi:hypothetical protein
MQKTSADPDPDPHQYIMDLQHWLVCWTQKFFLFAILQFKLQHHRNLMFEGLEKELGIFLGSGEIRGSHVRKTQ